MKQLIFTTTLLAILAMGCQKDQLQTLNPEDPTQTAAYYEAQAKQMLAEDNEDWSEGATKVQGPSVHILAGSVDALQAAIDNASPHTTIYLDDGVHTESQPVIVNKKIRLKGLGTAVLNIDTDPQFSWPFIVDAGLTVKNANGAIVEHLTIADANNKGGTAILVQNSNKVRIRYNQIESYQHPVVVQNGDKIRFHNNEITCVLGDPIWGYVQVNGEKAKIYNNTMTDCGGNFFLGDKNGLFFHNDIIATPSTTVSQPWGLLFCSPSVGGNFYILPDGSTAAAQEEANHWLAIGNHSEGFLWGFGVRDGANNNVMVNNDGANNSLYDIYLWGDELDGGGNIVRPAANNNLIISFAHPNATIKDCGQNNTILGGDQADPVLDPCP